MTMERDRYRVRYFLTLFFLVVIILPFGVAHADKDQDVQKILLPEELGVDLLNSLFVEANKAIVNDAPGSHFFGISITVWPFGDHTKRSPTFDVRFSFRKAGAVSSYVWQREKRQLEFKRDTYIAIGSEDCKCSPAQWSDVKRLNSFILFGYNQVSDRFTSHESSAYELNTNSMNYKCKWRLWFFHEGSNIGSFVLEKSGPKVD